MTIFFTRNTTTRLFYMSFTFSPNLTLLSGNIIKLLLVVGTIWSLAGCAANKPSMPMPTAFGEDGGPLLQLRHANSKHIKAPPGSATAGSTWIEFPVKFTNTSVRPIWFGGYALNSPWYSLFTKQPVSETWTKYGLAFNCLNELQQLTPGDSIVFSVSVPNRYVGQQLCVEIPIYLTPERSSSVTVRSNPMIIK